ncbi:type IV secretory system conjugative DNA transfer family protein [Nocardioides bruguierae]|uniref:TraM recognition domain-containing protein n=1 Tax=Nocardioides bruguierae TaxID=2945102 RepID=A0A9X2DCF8_9ACTN|nr:TraM recognition domain-containing protein [Nocardioides bruguierae]MCM0621929.1 TraM recognition domain-containing protein [Nocardioides bruguierae]
MGQVAQPADPVTLLLGAPWWLYVCVAGVVFTVSVLLLQGRPSRPGMATTADLAAQLGPRRLRRRVGEIRPDLARRGWTPGSTGWRLGHVGRIGRGSLWVPYDRTTLVIGPQGSGKTLDLLTPALLTAPGAALVTLTKPQDLYLTYTARSSGDGPAVVLDSFGLVPGLPPLVWDPVAGCVDPQLAERRAKAFASGALDGTRRSSGEDASRFYAGECAKVLQAYFHAAALAGLTLDEVLRWVADPLRTTEPERLLATHPDAEPYWDGLLQGALRGDERTAANTITTVQQAMSLFFQSGARRRCVPGPGAPATDLRDLIRRGGTIYLLGREDPYTSAAPLMTAVAEDALDIAKRLGETSENGRLCPPFLACLDELPSTAPIPTLLTRLANERALGVCFIVAAQTWRQLTATLGEHGARSLLGLANNLVVFGGGKDGRFYQDVSDLVGQSWHRETRYSAKGRWSPAVDRSWGDVRRPTIEAAGIRRLPERRALLLAERCPPGIVRLRRCIEGKAGRAVLGTAEATRRRAR